MPGIAVLSIEKDELQCKINNSKNSLLGNFLTLDETGSSELFPTICILVSGIGMYIVSDLELNSKIASSEKSTTERCGVFLPTVSGMSNEK
jgi:hypothetical protein